MSFSEWSKVKLKDVTTKIGSGSTPRGGSSVYKESGIAFVRSQNVYNNYFDYSGLVYIDDAAADRLRGVTLYPNDVLLNITGDSVARCTIVPREVLPARINQHVCIIRADEEKLDYRFIKYVLVNPSMQKLMLSYARTGGTRAALTKVMIEEFETYLPPLQEQKAIANILSSLDEKIELNNQMNKTLEEMAQALFKRWFVDFEFPDENGQPYKSSGGEMIDSELGMIPRRWEVGKAEEFFDISIGKTPPRKEPHWFSSNSSDIKWVSISDLGNTGTYILNSSECLTYEAIEKHNVKVVPEDTVLLSFKLTLGRVAIANEALTTNEAIAHFKTKKEGLNKFIYLYLKRFNYEELGNTSSIAKAVNSKIIKAMPVLMPQDDILNNFNDIVKGVFNKIRNNQIETKSIIEIRDTLLPKLMSGEIRVTDLEN